MLSDPLFEVSIPNRERHSIGYLAKEFSSVADSDSDERVSLFFYFLQIWLRKLNLRQSLIQKKKRKKYFPHPTLFTSQGHKCQGERARFILRKTQKEVIQEEEELDRGTGVVPSRKRRQSCQKHTKVGGH